MSAIGTVYRLSSACQVDDTKASESECNVVIHKTSGTVRSTVCDQIAHLVNYFLSIEITCAVIACKSTHNFTSFLMLPKCGYLKMRIADSKAIIICFSGAAPENYIIRYYSIVCLRLPRDSSNVGKK